MTLPALGQMESEPTVHTRLSSSASSALHLTQERGQSSKSS